VFDRRSAGLSGTVVLDGILQRHPLASASTGLKDEAETHMFRTLVQLLLILLGLTHTRRVLRELGRGVEGCTTVDATEGRMTLAVVLKKLWLLDSITASLDSMYVR
jgi:hypothetical protein